MKRKVSLSSFLEARVGTKLLDINALSWQVDFSEKLPPVFFIPNSSCRERAKVKGLRENE